MVKKHQKSRETMKQETTRGIPHHPLTVCSIKLSVTDQQFLHDLSQQATDTIGRPISSSTLLRVMLHYFKLYPK